MDKMLRPILELTVIIPGLLLAYLPVRTYLRQPLHKLAVWLLPLLAGFCVSGGVLCYTLQITTLPVLIFLLPAVMAVYHRTLRVTIWKSGSIFLAVCAVFACVNSLSRAFNAILTARLNLAEMNCGSEQAQDFSIMGSACSFLQLHGILLPMQQGLWWTMKISHRPGISSGSCL